MPISSAEIAGLQGQFQGSYMQQAQYSGMIGGMMNMPGPPQMQGEQIAGGMMNRIGSVAGPVSSLGMGLLGLDPLSMGLRAGMGAYGAGAGVVGGAAAGLGVAGGMALPLMAAQYAGSQVMTGAQQQQQFNASMRQSFAFNNPWGQGFSNNQLGVMGADIRGMAGQTGPGGEISTFRELSTLAANMGRMGMATGVRDVTAFRQRFSEMLSTVKTIAQEMGTTLEQAQQAMASMRGSGVFRTSDQVKFAMQMRQYSVGGGLSTAELGAMANIGSQISRSVGGRGNAGAFAGMRTLGMVGSAVQSGTLSEEDIYNATGLYGAEGRQALATRQLESSASFLKSGRGRYFLASVAGRDGTLDEEGVNAWMSGGMGVGDTKGMANRNLGRTGRANFIRNEGRLRGAAMEKFGGLLPAMALTQWAGERGVDVNSMGDREMLFASRQLGMGMDELEATVKEARDLPKLMANMQTESQMDQQLKSMANRRRTQGIEGVKRKLEQARESVQNGLQQVGAEIYTSGADFIERYLNRMAGNYIETFNPDAIRASMTATSMNQFGSMTGIGRTSRLGGGMVSPPSGVAGAGFFGQTGDRSPAGRLMALLGTSDYDRASQAGYGSLFSGLEGMRPGAAKDKGVADAIALARRSYANMANPAAVPAFSFSEGMQQHLQDMYAGSLGAKQGMDRVNALQSALAAESAKGNAEATAALKQLQAASPDQKMAVALGIEKGGKITAAARLSAQDPLNVSLTGGRWLSEGQRATERGKQMTGLDWEKEGMNKAGIGAGLLATGPLGIVAAGALIPGAVTNLIMHRRQQLAAGEYTETAEGKAFARALAFGDKDELASAMQAMRAKTAAAQQAFGKTPHDGSKETQLRISQSELAAGLVVEAAAKNNRAPTDADLDAALANPALAGLGMTKETLRNMVQGVQQRAMEQRTEAAASYGKVMAPMGAARLSRINATGLFGTDGRLALSGQDRMGHTVGIHGGERQTVLAYQQMVQAQAALGSDSSPEAVAKAEAARLNFEKTMGGQAGDWRSLMAGAKQSESLGLYDIAAEQRRLGGAEREVARGMSRGRGAGGVLGGLLGVRFDRQNAELLRRISSGNVGANQISELLERAGMGGQGADQDKLVSELTRISNLKGGEQVKALAELKMGKGDVGEILDKKRKEQKEREDRDKNPVLDKIEGHLEKIATTHGRSLDLIATNTGLTATNTDKENGGGAGQPGQGPPGH